MKNGMIGEFVIVRCRDAGVHAGFLEANKGREALLRDSRRLWYWKAKAGAFLCGVSQEGLSGDSKVGSVVPRLHLTEACEIILCAEAAKKTIIEAPVWNK